MAVNKALQLTLISKFKSFCKHCTLHGMYYFYKSSSWGLHLLWALIIAASMTLCCFLGHMIWQKFLINPTLTVVETTHYSVFNIPFPAVTICDTDSVYLPNTPNITNLLTLRGYNITEINDFYKSFSEVKRKKYVPNTYVQKMHSLLEDLGYSLRDLLEMFKRPCSDVIEQCRWRTRPHNCSEMFRSVLTIKGHCCRFDIPYFMAHADNQTNFTPGQDVFTALDMVVKGQSSNGYSELYVYDSKEKLTLIDNPISLTPESFSDINIYVWAIDSSNYVKALPLSSRKCLLETDQNADESYHQGCMTGLILKRVVNRCKCLPFHYTYQELDVQEFVKCSWEHLSCVYETLETVDVDIKDVLSDRECYQRCDYVQYAAEVEFIKYQRHLSTMNETRSRVLVHFSQNTCMKYRREVIYTWDQMLANLGGIFGLCLGGSIISVIEIIWFLLEILFTFLGSWCKNPAVVPKKNIKNKVFIVSEKEMLPKKSSEQKVVGKYNFFN